MRTKGRRRSADRSNHGRRGIRTLVENPEKNGVCQDRGVLGGVRGGRCRHRPSTQCIWLRSRGRGAMRRWSNPMFSNLPTGTRQYRQGSPARVVESPASGNYRPATFAAGHQSSDGSESRYDGGVARRMLDTRPSLPPFATPLTSKALAVSLEDCAAQLRTVAPRERLGSREVWYPSERSWHDRPAARAPVVRHPLPDRERAHAHPVPLRGRVDLADACAGGGALCHHAAEHHPAPEGDLRGGRARRVGNL